jgi:hypothetical protein
MEYEGGISTEEAQMEMLPCMRNSIHDPRKRQQSVMSTKVEIAN